MMLWHVAPPDQNSHKCGTHTSEKNLISICSTQWQDGYPGYVQCQMQSALNTLGKHCSIAALCELCASNEVSCKLFFLFTPHQQTEYNQYLTRGSLLEADPPPPAPPAAAPANTQIKNVLLCTHFNLCKHKLKHVKTNITWTCLMYPR